MDGKIPGPRLVATGATKVTKLPACVPAIFYTAPDNPVFPDASSDERGAFFAFDYAEIQPQLVEVIQSVPTAVRGNHIHRHCTETFSVMTGSLDIYLLCQCPQMHVYTQTMTVGTTVSIPPGIAHAMYAHADNQSTAVFSGGDPRGDREKVPIISS